MPSAYLAITYDAGCEDDFFYMTMEFIDGKNLTAHTRPSGLMDRSQVLEIIYNVCFALDYIHKKGYVHLDIKPSNIMLTAIGEVKLMDFGISRLLKDMPAPQGMTGSLYYMSPEQIDPGRKLDFQTDIYSLGVVAYQLLTGKRPFTGDTGYQVFYKIMNDDPEPLDDILPDISPDIVEVVQRAMAKRPEDRFESARAFAEGLLPMAIGEESCSVRANKRVDPGSTNGAPMAAAQLRLMNDLLSIKQVPFCSSCRYSEGLRPSP